MQNVFDFRDQVVKEYESYSRSFVTIRAADISEKVESEYKDGRYWPDPLIQINPGYKRCVTDSELLNVYNGFLLAANLDALFDRGLITFNDTGKLVCSSKLSAKQKSDLNLSEDLHLRWINDCHLPFLHWHQQQVFKKQDKN